MPSRGRLTDDLAFLQKGIEGLQIVVFILRKLWTMKLAWCDLGMASMNVASLRQRRVTHKTADQRQALTF